MKSRQCLRYLEKAFPNYLGCFVWCYQRVTRRKWVGDRAIMRAARPTSPRASKAFVRGYSSGYGEEQSDSQLKEIGIFPMPF